jgi:hypothetical protein
MSNNIFRNLKALFINSITAAQQLALYAIVLALLTIVLGFKGLLVFLLVYGFIRDEMNRRSHRNSNR